MSLCWIDVLTPKQAMFTSKLAPKLESSGFDVEITTRKYREAEELAKRLGLNARPVGRHGGGSLRGKLEASIERMMLLTKLASELRPDVLVSFASVEAARVAYGLGIPQLILCDSPHAEAVVRLTVPLAQKLLTPWVIPKDAWTCYGISEERIIHYRALDPWVWLKDLKDGSEKILEELGLDSSLPLVVCRVAESRAAYLLGDAPEVGVAPRILRLLSTLEEDFNLVVVPRYESQISELRRLVGSRGVVLDYVIDGPRLLKNCSVFIGSGGTMNTEAALLGVPTLTYFPHKPYIIQRFLMDWGLVYGASKPEKLVEMVRRILRDLDEYRETHKIKAEALVSGMEDPLPKVVSALKGILGLS